MFEDQTFDVIEKRILSDVDDAYHKDEGSFIYTATAPTSAEHQQIYIDLDRVVDEMFPDTSSREYLLHHAKLRGLEPKEATQALWIAQATPTDAPVTIGSRFNAGDINLQVVQKYTDGKYLLKVETAGAIGNTINDDLVAISYIKGLTSMKLTELSESGTDDETTEEFRERFLIYLQKPATSGNKNSYYNWAMDVDGVGDVKIFAPPDTVDGITVTDGNVYIYAVNEEKEPAGEKLIASMLTYIEEERPIGAKVTIKAPTELKVNIAATVDIDSTASASVIKSEFETAVSTYLKENAMNLRRVSIAKIGDLLFDIDGVDDYDSMTLNESEASIVMGDTQLAVLGDVELNIVNVIAEVDGE